MSSSLGSKLGSKLQKLELCWESPFPSVEAVPEAEGIALLSLEKPQTSGPAFSAGSTSLLAPLPVSLGRIPTPLVTVPTWKWIQGPSCSPECSWYEWPECWPQHQRCRYLSNQIPKSPLFTTQTILWRHSRSLPLSRWNWPWATSQKAHDECVAPWQETIEGAFSSDKLLNSHKCIYIYIFIHTICTYEFYVYIHTYIYIHAYIYIYYVSLPMTWCVALLNEFGWALPSTSSSKRAAGESRGGEATEEEDAKNIGRDPPKAAYASTMSLPMTYPQEWNWHLDT